MENRGGVPNGVAQNRYEHRANTAFDTTEKISLDSLRHFSAPQRYRKLLKMLGLAILGS